LSDDQPIDDGEMESELREFQTQILETIEGTKADSLTTRRGRDDWLSERQFLGIVASEMKRVLIDAARRKRTAKRGGDRNKVSLSEGIASEDIADSITELNEAIEQFEQIAPKKAELVRLRYFLGLSETEAAEMLGISRATASRHWAFARAWLLDYMTHK